MGQFIISENEKGEFLFNFKDGNGDTVLTSEIYTSKDYCKNGIQCAKNNSLLKSRYEKKTISDEHFQFYLRSSIGNIVGTSPIYISQARMESVINYMINVAEDSAVV